MKVCSHDMFYFSALFHSKSCNNTQSSTNIIASPFQRFSISSTSSIRSNSNVSKRLQSSTKQPSSSQTKPKSNASTKYFTTKTVQDNPPTSIENELSQLRSEIATLSYLIKQTASHQVETQTLARRAEARAHIIEDKLINIQSHVIKIPANLEKLVTSSRETFTDIFKRVNESSASFLTNKYTLWGIAIGMLAVYQYKTIMYQRTSEEVANVAALTLQQDSLRKTIQETLTTVANSPETLNALSLLFQKLITEKHTEEHLINLIVRALKSEGVRDAAIYLLDVAFQNEQLQVRAGDFLKVAANATLLDENVQQNAGIGIQHALKNAVVPWWVKKLHLKDHSKDVDRSKDEENDHDGKEDEENRVDANAADDIPIEEDSLEIDHQ